MEKERGIESTCLRGDPGALLHFGPSVAVGAHFLPWFLLVPITWQTLTRSTIEVVLYVRYLHQSAPQLVLSMAMFVDQKCLIAGDGNHKVQNWTRLEMKVWRFSMFPWSGCWGYPSTTKLWVFSGRVIFTKHSTLWEGIWMCRCSRTEAVRSKAKDDSRTELTCLHQKARTCLMAKNGAGIQSLDREQRTEDQKAKWKNKYIIFYLEYKRRSSTSPKMTIKTLHKPKAKDSSNGILGEGLEPTSIKLATTCFADGSDSRRCNFNEIWANKTLHY